MFALVIFKNNDDSTQAVEAVPFSWLSKDLKKCFWPPSSVGFQKALDKLVKPDTSWESFDIDVKYTTATLAHARKKRNQFVESSNLDSSDPSDEDEDVSPGKSRKIHPRKSRLRATVETANSSFGISESFYFQNADENEGSVIVLQAGNENAPLSSNLNFENLIEPPPPIFPNIELSFKESPDKSNPDDGDVTSNILPVSASTPKVLADSAGFQRAVLKKLGKIAQNLEELTLEVRELKRSASVVGGAPYIRPGVEGMPKIPLMSVENVDSFNTFLSSQEDETQLIYLFAGTGGHTIKQATNRIMEMILSDELACAYNWAGKKPKVGPTKIAFKATLIPPIVIKSVQKLFGAATAQEVEDTIKDWLKNAPARFAKK